MQGAFVQDGSWWWHRTAELLQAQDMTSVAPALPSCGETGTPGGASGPGLTEDVAAVRGVLTSSDESTVIVAHSYGGIVVAEAAAGVNAVRHLVLVSSYLPEAGQSLSEFGDSDGASAPFLDVDLETGTFGVRPELLVETFLQDCDSDVQAQAQAAARLARQSVQVTAQPVGAAAWKRTPSTYLVCTQDRGTPPRLQGEFRASRRDDGRARHRPPPLPVAAGPPSGTCCWACDAPSGDGSARPAAPLASPEGCSGRTSAHRTSSWTPMRRSTGATSRHCSTCSVTTWTGRTATTGSSGRLLSSSTGSASG